MPTMLAAVLLCVPTGLGPCIAGQTHASRHSYKAITLTGVFTPLPWLPGFLTLLVQCAWCSVLDLERYDVPDDLGPRPKLEPADEVLLQVGDTAGPDTLQRSAGRQLPFRCACCRKNTVSCGTCLAALHQGLLLAASTCSLTDVGLGCADAILQPFGVAFCHSSQRLEGTEEPPYSGTYMALESHPGFPSLCVPACLQEVEGLPSGAGGVSSSIREVKRSKKGEVSWLMATTYLTR